MHRQLPDWYSVHENVIESRVVLDVLVRLQQTFLAKLFRQDVSSEHSLRHIGAIQVVHAVSAHGAVLFGVCLAAIVPAQQSAVMSVNATVMSYP